MDDVFMAAPSGEVWRGGRSSTSEGTDASRYFAAAAYRDRSFRRGVLQFVRHGWYRARAPEFGINEPLVVEHCRLAERREHIRDAGMLLAFVVVGHTPLAWLIYSPERADRILEYFGLNLLFAFVAAGLVLFIERLLTEHFTTARRFGRENFAETSARAGAAADDYQNLVVYGGYSPFVGSGYQIGGWSFSVNLERTRDEFGVVSDAGPFTARDLLHFIENRLDRLHVDGLRHYHMLFADGRLAHDNAVTLYDHGRPKRHIPLNIISQLEDSSSAGTRSYLCINVADWKGEIILSIYLRCKKGESNLFVEASYFLLTPPKRDFFKIDELDPQLRLGAGANILAGSMMASPIMLVVGIFRLLNWALSPIVHWLERRRIRRSIKRNPRFNFGAVTSIRELGMENYYRVYFQQLDKERHVKTIEQCTIDAIVEFLEAHNIDTSDIRDRRSAILNNGVIVAGGDVHAENMAVGSGAKAGLPRFGARIGSGSSAKPHPVRSTA
jgi:hypothetical protein